ncbi:MAG TPA: PEP-CTERM sorting domain-containing protein [Steroidobacteraceae bacterium]|nr:PEP-CTERM sorting domain-containing protein [Steroidobacteraceae bacterium]
MLAAMQAYAVTIDFDHDTGGAAVADGTAINSLYASVGVTFDNPLGNASIFARSSTLNNSSPNVVSVFQTGVPAFDARFGAVEAVFGSAQSFVSIDAAILRLPEGLGTPTNAPKLEIYDNTGAFITAISWNFGLNPQPDVGGFAGWQTLSYTSASANIGKVRFLSGQPGGGPSNFGLFDNLTYNAGSDGGGGTSVPEPATLALFGFGAIALGAARRRRLENKTE